MSEKKKHSTVHYDSGTPSRECDKCVMYIRRGPHCTDVVDPIYPTGVCDIFARGKPHEDVPDSSG